MRLLALAFCFIVLSNDAIAEGADQVTQVSSGGRELFGALLIDEDLQNELRMSPEQVKRMREIYLQYSNPSSVVFSVWGIKNLDVSKEQMRQFHEMRLQDNQARLRVLFDKKGKYKDGEKLQKVNEMEAAFGRNSLSILTLAQKQQFERLKGKPFNFRPKKTQVKPKTPMKRSSR